MDVRGSMICMPNSFVLWKPKRVPEITVESLRIVELIIPKIGKLIRLDACPLRKIGCCLVFVSLARVVAT